MKNAIHYAIVFVLGVDPGIEVELKTTSNGAQFHLFSLNFPGFLCDVLGFEWLAM